MRMNLRQIEAFRAAMEFGSATAASEVLHVTQPAVSRLLADLERRGITRRSAAKPRPAATSTVTRTAS